MNDQWNRCARYGRIEIDRKKGNIQLFFTPFDYEKLVLPRFFWPLKVEWEGKNLVIFGNKQCAQYKVVMTGFNQFKSYTQVANENNPSSMYYNGELMTLEIASPDRFVWHLTGAFSKRRKGILTYGLLPVGGLVFANTYCFALNEMWHWEFEWRYCGRTELQDDLALAQICRSIDFWRIDTQKVKAKWYKDPNLNPYYLFNGQNIGHRYICTPQNIPTNAIELYKFDLKKYRKIKYGKTSRDSNGNFKGLPLVRVHNV